MNKKTIIFVLSLIASAVCSSNIDLDKQSFLGDMITNILKTNKPKNFMLKQAAPIDQTCTLSSFSEPSDSLEAAVPHVVEHMGL